ncbi:MAG: hypothetical protein LKH59_07870 [Lactobacillus crispatus]|jgi:hypothetical protein|uniref:hypothetical protein n=1 Tax=Lactobacillus crispatus TaxID=47770 RepID=UPI0018AB33F2|nr:hypothetical protein [Lactobacillus crispatus]MCH4005492.1 hypothetical protein [Lactobacillus crispatus]MCI1336605.1 hypothetical protein [Lactobacillus crispatus]MCI1366163.1 hypothetical protein [Lactobacillus crispatus]MCI1494483.1 hypothetical protein [Lactobacillus crispatus]MCI1538780.1 hypothetical protein [Lactobacillus crispatus]
MTKKQITIRSIIVGCLYFVLDLALSVVLKESVTTIYVLETMFESILFTVFMIWLLKMNKDSKKINSNGSFLKYFSIGMKGSWIIFTIMLFLKVGNRMSKVMVDDTALLIGTYLVVGELALYIVFRKATKSDWFRKSR